VDSMNADEINLKVGLEIHQQLSTKEKLFCSCMAVEEECPYTVYRVLRPTQSELGQVDTAARFEFSKGLTMKYSLGPESSCLVEVDEEPPHPMNDEAILTSLIISLALNSRLVDEFHIMRKIVIDGSNTTGFQRTLLVALGGEISFGGKSVPVQTISLEEDAARITGESKDVREYCLDRLSIPLVEIALAPFSGTAKEVQELALSLGRLLRSTRRVSRGLGTIRQDVNVSILGGNVVEVKGVQKLDLVEKIVEFEKHRQLALVNLKSEFEKRGLVPENYRNEPDDVSKCFEDSANEVVRSALLKGGVVYSLKLKGLSGLLGLEPYPGVRFGRELADIARFYGLGGLLHSDELPSYDISQSEVDEVRRMLNLKKDDGFLLLSGEKNKIISAYESIMQRIHTVFIGVPAETRGPTPDGKTRFIRPRPGSARMYPETDIPPKIVSLEMINEAIREIPRPWTEQISEYESKYSLSRKLALQIYDSPHQEVFERVAVETTIPPSFIAATLTETLVSLSRTGLNIGRLTDRLISSLFSLLDKKMVTKESIPSIIELLVSDSSLTVEDAVAKLGISSINDESVSAIVMSVLKDNESLIAEKGLMASGSLMGQVMSQVRGKADGKKVSAILKTELDKFIKKNN